MAFVRLPINSLSGGVGRQAPTKRLVTEAENVDNCLVTVEKSVEKRPPLTRVTTTGGGSYLDLVNVSVPPGLNFNNDNLYFHFLDIDGFNRYCIVINRAGYTFDPVTQNSFSSGGQDIKLDNFLTVYRIEPTEWIKETVDATFGTVGNTSGFNRGIYEYLTYGNRSVNAQYRMGNQTYTVSPSPIKDTFGSTDFDVGIILWNKLVPLDFLPDNSQFEAAANAASWYSAIPNNEYIHSGDTINYKRSRLQPQTPDPNFEDSVTSLSSYWINVRDDIEFIIDTVTLEEEEVGQNLENFESIPQYPASEVKNDVADFNGYRALRAIYDYYDVPRLIPIPGGVINWNKDHYHQTSPFTPLDRDGVSSAAYKGFGKVYLTRNSYLTFPNGFYRATRYTKNPYFERLRTENPKSVIDHRRMPIIIYKDTDGVWRVKHMPVMPRRTGNDVNNPGPKALERKEKIQSIAIWKNRLWMATDNTILASRTNSFFDFWVNDITNIVETDPIDIQASVGAYNKLSHIIPFQNILFVLSSGSVQFEVRGGSNDVGMSPFNVELRPTSFYTTSKLEEPMKMGNNVFFFNAGKLFMYLSGSALSDEFSTSMDISTHCKDYLPQNIGAMNSSSATNSLFAVDEDNKRYIYIFTFRTNGKEIIQNAFHRWILSTQDSVVGIKSYEKDMYIISKRLMANGSYKLAVYFVSLETVPVTTPMLDWLTLIPTSSMVYLNGVTTITLPYYDPAASGVVLSSGWGNRAYEYYTATTNTINPGGNTELTLSGNYTNFSVWVGRPYEMNVELSQQVYRGSQDASTVYEGVLNLKRITTRHLNTGKYDIVVDRRGRLDSAVSFYPTDINSILTLVGNLKIDSVGEHFAKLLSYSEACKIYIKSNYPTPCNISNIEILGNFRSRNTSIE